MLPQDAPKSNQVVPLYDADTYPWEWIDGFVGYVRTSPAQDGSAGSGDYQEHAIRELAKSVGRPVHHVYKDAGIDSRSRHAGRSDLIRAVEHARRMNCPIVIFDRTRLGRGSLRNIGSYGVDFVSICPLDASAPELASVRKKAANELARSQGNLEAVGGRPRDVQTAEALPFILSRLGNSWRSIGRELGWNDRKVRRLFGRYFRYEDKLSECDKTP